MGLPAPSPSPSPLPRYATKRDFKVVQGKLACKLCDDNILRTVAGHDWHMRKVHDCIDTAEESTAGGLLNPNVPKGRDSHRASLLKELKALGVTTKELVSEGYTLGELKAAGYTVKDILSSPESPRRSQPPPSPSPSPVPPP